MNDFVETAVPVRRHTDTHLQVTIPPEVADRLHIQEGDYVEWLDGVGDDIPHVRVIKSDGRL